MANAKKPTIRRKTVATPGKPTGSRSRKAKSAAPLEIAPEERRRMIAAAAYQKAERRGFATGREMDDWLEAESEIDRMIGAA